MAYISQSGQIQLKLQYQKIISDSKLIKGIIDRWEGSQTYRDMINGKKYFRGEHDILNIDFSQIQVYNDQLKAFEVVEDKNAPKIAIENPFHKVLNTQKAGYMASEKIQFKVADSDKNAEAKAFENDINNELRGYFQKTAFDWVIGAGNKGEEVLMVYVNVDGEFDYMITPRENVIPDYDENTGKLLSVMRYYNVDSLKETGEINKIRRVEIWDSNSVNYFIEDETTGNFVPEATGTPFSFENQVLDMEIPSGWGKPPFIFLSNNSYKLSDLKNIKNSIDAYDAVKTGLFHDTYTIQQVLFHINDYEGTDISELRKKLSILKGIKTQGADGKFEAIQIDIPFDAKETILKRIKKDIYTFGEGVDLSDENFAGDITGVALKLKFALLNSKADRTILELEVSLKEFIWFLVYYMQMKKNANVDPAKVTELANSVSYVFKKSMMTNDTETINNLINSKQSGIMSTLGAMRKHPYIDNVEQNQMEVEAEHQQAMTDYNNFGNPGGL